jgi:hypothetical protein
MTTGWANRRDRWMMEADKLEEKSEQECGEFPEWINV